MKILNLYAGIGGNRALWSNKHQVTAVEYDSEIAEIYKMYYPNDEVIVTDAHLYLLKNYKKYDFIWSSPPCQTHTRLVMIYKNQERHQKDIKFPDMKLYEEIIFLKHFFNGYWVVENVKPYYKPLINPNIVLDRHNFWSNINISKKKFKSDRKHIEIEYTSTVYGFNIQKNISIKEPMKKKQILRNLVNPEVSKHIMDCLEIDIYNKETNLFNISELVNN